MKKLTLLLFLTGLLVITLANTDCRRKDSTITPISGDTITKPPVKDTSGCDIDVQVFIGTTVSGGQGPGSGARLYLINNFDDYTNFPGDSGKSTIVKATCDGSGMYTFPKVKPPSNTTNTPSYFKGTNTPYVYYVWAYYLNPQNGLYMKGEQAPQGGSTAVTVPINNSKGHGVNDEIAVNY